MHCYAKHRRHYLFAALAGSLALVSGHSTLRAATVEAFAGKPFGVGRITLDVGRDQPVVPLEDERFTVKSADGRILYPVIKEEPARRILRDLLDIDSPRFVTIYFLFRGDGPLDVEAFSPHPQAAAVTPQADAGGHRRLMDEWWQEYVNRWKKLRQNAEFPPVVENFLAANLSRRLGRELPEPTSGLLSLLSPQKTAWDELLASERHLMAVDQALLKGGAASSAAEPQPLPAPMPWYALEASGAELEGVAVEPIALHVPSECFYLRFGTFSNYLWFRDLNKKWQGDLGNMLRRRGIDRAGADRVQQQLSLRDTALAKIVGPSVIEDVAMIGLDPYFPQGAAFGILFQAKNNALLASDLNGKRREALEKFPDAKETTVRIAERDVSLIASPGREVYSYYVADGDFHLVATSERLVQRFLQAGQKERPLAASAGFLRARQRLPLDRGDAVFAYVSPDFFRELTSPAVWIESQRRVRSARKAKVLELVRLQATAEGVAATTRDELIAAGFLPAGFGARHDGSELREEAGAAVDSVRGTAGLFTPVGDMVVENVTAAEVAAYKAFASAFRQEIGQTPPIAVGVRRVPLADETGETMAVDVLAMPLDDVKLGRLPDIFGEPSSKRVGPVEGDLVRAELVLDFALPPLSAAEAHHLFLGVRDFRSPLVARQGKLAPGAPPEELVRMYLGAWPRPGLTKLFLREPPADGPEPVPASQNAWQGQREDFLLMTFKPDLVREVLPQLEMQPVEEPAQAWVDVSDLTGTELSGTVSALGYMRSREASVAACRLMNTLVNQLHAPPETSREIAERLMDGKFVCALGGEYQLVDTAGGHMVWTSSALSPANRFLLTEPPEDFELPLLSWFKGLRGAMRLTEDELAAHLEVDMAASAVP